MSRERQGVNERNTAIRMAAMAVVLFAVGSGIVAKAEHAEPQAEAEADHAIDPDSEVSSNPLLKQYGIKRLYVPDMNATLDFATATSMCLAQGMALLSSDQLNELVPHFKSLIDPN